MIYPVVRARRSASDLVRGDVLVCERNVLLEIVEVRQNLVYHCRPAGSAGHAKYRLDFSLDDTVEVLAQATPL